MAAARSIRCFACRAATPVSEAVTTATRVLLICSNCFTVLVDRDRVAVPAPPVQAVGPASSVSAPHSAGQDKHHLTG